MLSRLASMTLKKGLKNGVVVIPQRFGSSLPVDYSNVHIHDPIEMFYGPTSSIYDPLVTNGKPYEQIKKELTEALNNAEVDYLKFLKEITDPQEKEAYENVFGPIFLNATPEELAQPFSEDHFILDQLNDPTVHDIPRRFGTTDVTDVVFEDLFDGHPQDRAMYAAGLLITLGSAAAMLYLWGTNLSHWFNTFGEHHHDAEEEHH